MSTIAHRWSCQLADRGLAAPLDCVPGAFCLMASGGFSIRLDGTRTHVDPLYVLELANSRLLFWYLRQISNRFRGGWITCTKQYFGQLPIRLPDSETAAQRTACQGLSDLVRERIRLSADGVSALAPDARMRRDSDVATIERQIDHAVYELYGLSQADVALVERAAG